MLLLIEAYSQYTKHHSDLLTLKSLNFLPYDFGRIWAQTARNRTINSFHPLKEGGGRKKFYTLLRGGANSFGPAISHFVAPLPVINDQSLGILLVITG